MISFQCITYVFFKKKNTLVKYLFFLYTNLITCTTTYLKAFLFFLTSKLPVRCTDNFVIFYVKQF